MLCPSDHKKSGRLLLVVAYSLHRHSPETLVLFSGLRAHQCDLPRACFSMTVQASAESACKASRSVMHVFRLPSNCNFFVTISSTLLLNGCLPYLLLASFPLPKFPIAILSTVNRCCLFSYDAFFRCPIFRCPFFRCLFPLSFFRESFFVFFTFSIDTGLRLWLELVGSVGLVKLTLAW